MFLLTFLLAQREAQARQLLLAILTIIVAYAALGIAQELIGWRLGGGDERGGNVVSTFVNRNHFATYANLGLLIAMGFIAEPLLRGGTHGKQRLGARIAQAITTVFEERRYVVMAAFVLLLAVVGSASRGGLLSLIGAGLFFMVIVLLVSRVARSSKAIGITAGIGVIGFVIWLTGDTVLARFQSLEEADTLFGVDGRSVLGR